MLNEKERNLLSMQVKQLYALAPVGIIASLINGPILTFIQWNLIPHGVLLSWLFALIVLNVLWGVLWHQFRKALQGPLDSRCWIRRFVGGTLASGFIWGKSITSRMDDLFVSNITSRSIPIPMPAVGGKPCASART